MSHILRTAGRPYVIAAACVLAALLPVGAATATPSESAGEVVPTVTLDPTSAPAGTQVTATATGFGGCASVVDAPEAPTDEPTVEVPALRMVRVTLLLVRTPTVDPGTVRFHWDGVGIAEAPVSGGTAVATFNTPVDASVGEHDVDAACDPDAGIRASRSFVVEPPVETPTIVPPLIGLTLDEAERRLGEADLLLGEAQTPDGDRIRSQSPDAGTEAERGSTVDVVLGTTSPTRVRVPDLSDLETEEARSRLEAVGLALGTVSGTGVVQRQSHAPGTPVPSGTVVDVFLTTPGLVTVPRLIGLELAAVSEVLAGRGLVLGEVAGDAPRPEDVVRRQSPPAGTRVPSGSAVTVSVEPGVRPETLVPVPDLVDGSVADARAALGELGLVLGSTADDDATVEGQSPAAGVLVPQGTAVTVTVTAPSSGLWSPATLWAVIVLVAVIAASSLIGARLSRSRRARPWPRKHVRVVPGTSPRPTYTTEERAEDPPVPTRTIRIEPHPDSGTHVLEEVDR